MVLPWGICFLYLSQIQGQTIDGIFIVLYTKWAVIFILPAYGDL
jgi:hypothetical protein